MLIAHISDTHLGYRQYNLDEREEDIYRLFNEMIEKTIAEKPSVVIHTGDLFDQPRPPVKALRVAYQGFRKLRDRGIRVYCILGDHDIPKRRGEPPHKLLQELGVIEVIGYNPLSEEPYRVINDILIAGLRNMPKKYSSTLISLLLKLSTKAKEYSKAIIMLHQGIKEHFPYSYELELKHLPPGFNYYALGHIHMRTWFHLHDGIVGYAGSMDIIRIDEWEDYVRNGKGFYLVDLSKREPIIHKIDLEGIRQHIIIEVNYRELDKKLKEVLKIANGELKPILHLTVKGDKIDKTYVQRLLLRMLQGKVLTWRLRFEEASKHKDIRKPVIEKIDIEQLIKEVIRDEEVAELALKLIDPLASGDIDQALKITEEYYKLLGGGVDNKKS